MSGQLWLVVKEPGKAARVTRMTIDAALAGMIGPGVLFDVFRFDASGIHGYCDDDGIAKGLAHNFHRGNDPIVGGVVFSRCDAGGDDIGFVDRAEALAFATDLNRRVMP